jgi:hypothetical protein
LLLDHSSTSRSLAYFSAASKSACTLKSLYRYAKKKKSSISSAFPSTPLAGDWHSLQRTCFLLQTISLHLP